MLHRSKILEVIKALGNQIIGITFIKKNGDVRKMSCRARVRKYVKGVRPGGSAKTDNSQITMYEMKGTTGADNYRSVNLDTITSIRCWGIEAEVTPDPVVETEQLQLINVA